jgi:Conjugative transposon, TraM
MAEIKEFVTTKEEANKRKRIDDSKKKKPKTPEEKKKLIVYSVFGFLVLLFVGYLATAFGGDDTKKEVTEIEAPESETEKYNSRLEAIEGKDKTGQNPDLTESFSKENTQADEEETKAKLEQELSKLGEEKSKKESNIAYEEPPQRNNNTRRNSGGGGSSNYQRTAPADNYVPAERITKREVVTTPKEQDPVEEKRQDKGSGFFKNAKSTSPTSAAVYDKPIYACIHTDQTITDGSRIKMRLTKGITIDGNVYPINTILYGTAKISPNRLNVEINKINQTDVKLQIFDAEDSNPGIYVETPNLNAMVRKEFKKDVLEEKDLEKVPFSKTLKNLFSKKAKEENIELLNNYKIIIKQKKDEN